MPGLTTRRYGTARPFRPFDSTVGAVHSWRGRFITPWNTASPWTAYDEFGVTTAGSLPTFGLVPLGTVWDQPVSRWTLTAHDGHVQDAYQVQVATDPSFSSVEEDSGVVASTAVFYQHVGLTNGLKYRRGRGRVNSTDWSEWDYDSFTLAAKTSQSVLVQLTRLHRDGIESKIYVPISSVAAVRTFNAPGGFEFVVDNFYPWCERSLVACHHFDELTGAVAHDIFGENHLALSGAPAWTSGVLNLTGTEYGVSGPLTLTLSGDWTAYIAGLFAGASGCIWYLGDDSDDANYYSVAYNGSGKVRIVSAAGNSADLTISTTSPLVLRVRRSGTQVALERLDSGANVSQVVTATGTAHVALGRYSGATPGSVASAAKLAGHLLYANDLTDDEDLQNLDAYRGNLVHRSLQLL